eukprot:scaffold614_cov367-Prasinococcus_capsulatus_cf.AAC.31
MRGGARRPMRGRRAERAPGSLLPRPRVAGRRRRAGGTLGISGLSRGEARPHLRCRTGPLARRALVQGFAGRAPCRGTLSRR